MKTQVLSLFSLLTFAVALGSVEYNHNEAFEGVFASKNELMKSVQSKSSNKDPQAIPARKEDPIHKQALARRERNAKLASDESFRKAEFEKTVQDLTKSREENHEQHLKQIAEHATRLNKRSQSEESLLSLPAAPLAQPAPSMYYVLSNCQSLGGDYYPLSGDFYPLDYCFVSTSGSYKYMSYDAARSTIYYSSANCSGPIYYYSNSSSYPTTPCGPSNSYYSASVVSAANVPTGFITSYYTRNSTYDYQCSQPESYSFQVNTCEFYGCTSSYSTVCSTDLATGDVISTYSYYSPSNTCQGTPYYSSPSTYSQTTCGTGSYYTYSCTSSTVDFNNFNSQMSFPTMSPSVMPSTQEYYVKTEGYYNSYTNYTTYQTGTFYPLVSCLSYSSSQSFQYVTIEQYGYSSLYELDYCSADCSGPMSSTTQMYNYSNTPMVDSYFSAVVEEANLPQGYLSYNLQYNYTSGDYLCDAVPESVDFQQGCISYGTSSYQYQCGFDQGDIVQITNSYYDSNTCGGNVSYYSNSYSSHSTCSPNSYYYYTCSDPVPVPGVPVLSPTYTPVAFPTYSPNYVPIPPTSYPTNSPTAGPTQAPLTSYFVVGTYAFESYDGTSQHELSCAASDGPSSPPIGQYFPLDWCFNMYSGTTYKFVAESQFPDIHSMVMKFYSTSSCSGEPYYNQTMYTGHSTCGNLTADVDGPYSTAVIPASTLPHGIVSTGYPCADYNCNTYDCSQNPDMYYITRTGVCVTSNVSSVSASCSASTTTYNAWTANYCPLTADVSATLYTPAHTCTMHGGYSSYCTDSSLSVPTASPVAGSSSSSSSSTSSLTSGGTAGVVIGVIVGVIIFATIAFFVGKSMGATGGMAKNEEVFNSIGNNKI